MFLFSAGTFDQLAMRYKYMEQYSTARRDQAEVIRRVHRTALPKSVAYRRRKKDDKNKLLQEEVSEKE